MAYDYPIGSPPSGTQDFMFSVEHLLFAAPGLSQTHRLFLIYHGLAFQLSITLHILYLYRTCIILDTFDLNMVQNPHVRG